MQMDKKILLVRAVAIVTAGTAVYLLVTGHLKYWWHLFQLFIEFPPLFFHHFDPFIFLLSMVVYLIIIFKFIAAFGMFKLESWSRKLAISVLSVDFLLRLAGAINTLTWYLRHPEAQPISEIIQGFESGEVEVVVVSLLSSYIIGAISLIFIIILTRRFVKELLEGPPIPKKN
jgi:hypothetical protein